MRWSHSAPLKKPGMTMMHGSLLTMNRFSFAWGCRAVELMHRGSETLARSLLESTCVAAGASGRCGLAPTKHSSPYVTPSAAGDCAVLPICNSGPPRPVAHRSVAHSFAGSSKALPAVSWAFEPSAQNTSSTPSTGATRGTKTVIPSLAPLQLAVHEQSACGYCTSTSLPTCEGGHPHKAATRPSTSTTRAASAKPKVASIRPLSAEGLHLATASVMRSSASSEDKKSWR
mmetsp:Transcript_70265/g.126635  ORF Transcript_70265/g.126635 Transcript_70265/m.126635 type:complete len:230 (+) Transcript_70265:841-1530(+)